jgi:hypothetical protein
MCFGSVAAVALEASHAGEPNRADLVGTGELGVVRVRKHG